MTLPLKVTNRLRLGGAVAARVSGKLSPAAASPVPAATPTATASQLPPPLAQALHPTEGLNTKHPNTKHPNTEHPNTELTPAPAGSHYALRNTHHFPTAWIYVEPVVWTHQGLEQLLEGWQEMRQAGGAGETSARTYHLRYIELAPWHLEHPDGLGTALGERPVRDERWEVRGNAELARVLGEWLADLNELRTPAEAGYPYPPYRY